MGILNPRSCAHHRPRGTVRRLFRETKTEREGAIVRGEREKKEAVRASRALNPKRERDWKRRIPRDIRDVERLVRAA